MSEDIPRDDDPESLPIEERVRRLEQYSAWFSRDVVEMAEDLAFLREMFDHLPIEVDTESIFEANR